MFLIARLCMATALICLLLPLAPRTAAGCAAFEFRKAPPAHLRTADATLRLGHGGEAAAIDGVPSDA